MSRKDGGRESGASTTGLRAMSRDREPEDVGLSPVPAAADPAARPYHATHTCDETSQHVEALEAERDALKVRVAELEKEAPR